MDFQLIIPCYNEAKSLEAMITQTVNAAARDGYDPTRFQLIVVENGSADESQEILKKLSEGTLAPWFRLVSVEKNRGYGDGVMQGLLASDASYVGWTHADEQCDPKDAFRALTLLLASKDPAHTLVKGRRIRRKLFDYLWSRAFDIATLIFLRTPMYDINAQPKLFPRALIGELATPPHDLTFDMYVLWRARKAGLSFRSIPVIFAPRTHGTSHWAFSIRSRLRTGMKVLRYLKNLRKGG